jgi:hypothetical protein
MKKSLRAIYFDTIDRITFNSRPEAIKYKNTKEQLKRDKELKNLIEKVFENPKKYDVYYQKGTCKLFIDDMPNELGLKKNIFNRIDIKY